MASKGVNKLTLMGRIGSVPELRKTPSGKSVINFSLATNETYKDQNGQVQEITDWHTVVIWGGRAEVVNQHAIKGDQIYVEGKSRTRKYQAPDGSDRFVTECIVDQSGDMQLIGNKPTRP